MDYLRRLFMFLGFLLLASSVFAAVPIREAGLQGLSATEARRKVLAAADSYFGVRYRYGGIDRDGMDCSGLVYASFRNGLGYASPRTAEGIYNWAEKINTEELQPGDLVFFVTSGARVSHVGIYAGGGRFIHSASEGPSTGVIYSRLDESYWRRSYKGAGRALPWDSGAQSVTDSWPGELGGNSIAIGDDKFPNPLTDWASPGFFTGFGAAWTWGGFIEGAPSIFRGISLQATMGYKWEKYRAGLELRPEWDRALGVFRLPLTLSAGTDIFQGFIGPVYTFGEPSLNIQGGERNYAGGGFWLGELGFSAAFPVMQMKAGFFSLYGELAWQPYHWEDGESFSFKPDLTANFRFSTGARYLWRL